MSRWRGRFERVLGMVAKEFRQIFRDPRMVRVIFFAPIFQLIVFGYAVSTDLWKTKTFVVDHDNTRASRELVEALTASGYFQVSGRSQRPADLVRALDHGDAILGLQIPAGFASSLQERGGPARVQLLIDGTNSNTASVAQSYAERIVQSYALEYAPTRPIAVDFRERAWYNADLASRNYNVPAVVGALILLVCLLLTSLAVVREREIGTLEQLRVSPLASVELIAGKTIPFAVIGLVDLALVTTVALIWFGVPFRGSLLLLFGASVLYLLSGLGVGLLISTISKTQQEAFMASFLVFMPAILLSGFMFPVSSMPELFQWLTLVNPVRHYIEIVRAIFLKGTNLGALWPQFLALAGIGAGLLSFASSRFSKTAS
ncbi:MAG: ABC transporter permease [Gemmatimonadetes bacterium]|uniref:Transport permease protein n=1 Tax=Candidatus Kutchimonas denitrificans TaxID=3056748 RepID=A0AAE4Z9K8_9BACT|nr:ABC transporter permease [Gemmatimonadota bacterium]NIR75799.1 ABC transporter permease [Candidatus Kutchimonas denitrificans]NIS01967.1 ABC transporter permease [Gemmatimonadota bacterium]NIT67771.1 ABC transporter permease [Gemmatimonadota bacterium]NIU53758.1 ABC transporter permease [Gemmatimonadota bacterium]